METEGYSLEEMQMAIYGEFGIKVSINALKRRLFDDKSERRGKKRTGKTRRDRSKARNARFNPVVDKGITLPEGNVIQVAELARLMDVGAGEVVKHLMINVGVMTTMNMNIDMTLAKQVIEAFGKKLAGAGDENDEESDDEDDEDDEDIDMIEINSVGVERLPRPPVVTIMGHVDHGKTTLLDSIRKTQVAAGEAGGITQAISAFKVKTTNDQDVTFIDTPGHAAFRDMRKRGANMTDIVILVVAADDGIMEQTKESIAAAKAANCPIVVAINKIDKEGADPQAVMTALMSYDLLVEDFGGEIQCAKVSAKKGDGIADLLEKVLLQSEVMALKAPYDTIAGGSVIEARVDKGLGPVVTALVQKGTLRIGDYVLAGPAWGRVRRIISDQGKNLKEAGPSTPVQIVGMSSVPNAGDQFIVTEGEEEAREVAEARQRLARQASGSQSISSILAQAAGIAAGTGDNKEQIKVPIVIKADVSGSVEAIQSSILELQLSDEEATCKPDIVFAGVGAVTSSDVAIAAVSKAKIVAFNVAADMNAMDEARASNVEIGYYNVVYDLLDEIEAKIKKTLSPPPPGTLVGRAEIKKVFKIGKVGKIAGCIVTEGIIKMESQVRIMRGKRNPVFTGKLSTLKVVKDDVQEVPNGSECGMGFEDFQELEEGDVIECFTGGEKEK
jgi:translation initiation factor IF-2